MIVNDLVQENPIYLGQWTEAFRPVKAWSIAPLADIFRDHRPERGAERTSATNLLADYAAEKSEVLADLLMDADEKQFAVIYRRFQEHAEPGLPLLAAELDRKLPSDATNTAKESLAKRKANAAATLFRLTQSAKVWDLLKHRIDPAGTDPTVRSYLIHRLCWLGVDAGTIVKRLENETGDSIRRALALSLGKYDEKQFSAAEQAKAVEILKACDSIRRALILSLGEYDEMQFSAAEHAKVVETLKTLYRAEADPGIHGAAEWLLRKWQKKEDSWIKDVNDEWANGKVKGSACWVEGTKFAVPATKIAPPATRKWYVNGEGQTMVVIPGPVEFSMGSPPMATTRRDDELANRRKINRTFAIAAHAVTVRQYQRNPRFKLYGYMTEISPERDCPINGLSWYQAVEYCNWLSKEEGILEDQWCYEIKIDKGVMTVKLKKDYLSLTGYRLPTEAEWEYACRAGAATSRYYGESEELLPKYGWYFQNSEDRTWPVGTLKPNDLGLFDMHGNIWTWCQERKLPYPKGNGDEIRVDKEDDILTINPETIRVLRGGAYSSRASDLRSAARGRDAPWRQNVAAGLRPARTIVP